MSFPKSTLSEQDLIKGCILNDRRVQELLYKQYCSSLMVLCKSYTKNDEDAVEVLQDGFLKVFQQIERYDGDMDMFNSMEKNKAPKETFYDGYVVNCILDAAYRSAKTKQWEPVKLDIWRGRTGVTKESHLTEYDSDNYLVKEEMTHYGAKKVILKNKKSGKIIEKILDW